MVSRGRETKKRLRRIDASVFERAENVTMANFFAATLDFCAARSRSITARQPLERLARFLNMQAVIFGMFGISELQRRNASPVHICCASELKAWLAVDEIAEKAVAKASARLILRAVELSSVVMFGSHWPSISGPLLMVGACA